MPFLTSSVGIQLLAICGLAAAGVLPHHFHHQQQQHHNGHHVSSDAVVSKHEEPIVKHEFAHKVWEEHQADNGGDSSGQELAHFAQHSDHEDDAHEDYEGGHIHEEDYYAHPKYQYDYAVKDEKTGDSKKHWETRDGDKVATPLRKPMAPPALYGYNAVVKTVGHAHSEHESHDHSHYSH